MISSSPDHKINIIYILGSGHSGSTLIDLILGSHSAIESVGELNKIPEYISIKNSRKCTCGNEISKCNYWQSILKKINNPLAYNINDLENFDRSNYDLIENILDFSGKSVLVDSSKNSLRLEKLVCSKLFKITIVHLVRDGRAVGYSNKMKRKRIKDKNSSNNKKYNFYASVAKWNKENIKFYNKFSNENDVKYLLIRYEDLVAYPRQTISDIISTFELSFEEEQLCFYKFQHHNISGNRMRMSNNLRIFFDNKYQENLSYSEWCISTLIAYQGLILFDYPLMKYSKE